MRVGVDATCWANRRGYGRFTRGLLTALLERDDNREYLFFVDDHTHAKETFPKQSKCIVVPTNRSQSEAAAASSSRSIADMWSMTKAVAGQSLDAFFFPSVYTYFPTVTKASLILGVHDVIAEDYPDLVFPNKKHRALWTIKGWLAHKQSKYIMTVSEHAKKGIVRHFGHAAEKVFVIDEAADTCFRPLLPEDVDSSLLKTHGIEGKDRFFVYLGGINPHKNLVSLVECFNKVKEREALKNLKLVIIGDVKTESFTPGLAELKATINKLELEKYVIFTGYISDEQAVHFLNAAVAVVLPSFAEGFGLPALEGAACGTPVIATINSPLPELLRGGGIFIDPSVPQQLEQAISKMINEDSSRQQMADRARAKAEELTWAHSAAQMSAMLERVQAERRS